MPLHLFKTSSSRIHPHHYQNHQTIRFFIDARLPWVRDRALDHTVEREKHLKPMLALKNLIKSEPSKSIPISIAAENKTNLSLPTRAVDFIRKYPSIFQEFLPPGGNVARPHVRLTPEVLELDEEEQSIYDRESYREDVANRLLKLIMLTRINKIPIHILDRLKWDLGLPPEYARTLVTDFPDYFQITPMKGAVSNTISNTISNRAPPLGLELVCWSDELAVSSMEKIARKGDRGYKKGMPLAFPLQYSRGFEIEKKVKIWVDEWQKLPYISPYENASHLQSKSDQAEKWTVAVLHELLHLFISKKTERENIFCLGEYLGFGSRFKRALINHPGIFYVSNKIRTHTVVLREGFKRDLLVEKHPLMGMRYQYIHLMNKEVQSTGSTDANNSQKGRSLADKEERESEADNAEDDNYDDDTEDESEDEDEDEMDAPRSAGRGRMGRNAYGGNEREISSRTSVQTSSNRTGPNMVGDRVITPPPKRTYSREGYNRDMRSPGGTDRSRTRGRFAGRTA